MACTHAHTRLQMPAAWWSVMPTVLQHLCAAPWPLAAAAAPPPDATHWMHWSISVLMGAAPLWPRTAVMPEHHLTNKWLYR
jgi:hypothetical protein